VDWWQRSWPAISAFVLAPATVIGLTSFSVACCVASVLVATWAVRRLPVDYLLCAPDRPCRSTLERLGWLLRNAVGLVLLLLGLLMLVLPGQGLLTIVAALAVMDFRSKRRLEHWLLLQPKVFALVNHLRLRSGHGPLLAPEQGPGA
jgi:Putative transmembrane protein (PGPGW)